MDWKETKRVISADGKKLLVIKAASGNYFSFEEYTEVTRDGHTFWRPSGGGGLYDSTEAAERDALIELPWLRNQSSN